MTQSPRSGVVAVVVTYQPALEVLEQLLDALVPQVTSVVVVDNGSHSDLAAWNSERDTRAVELLRLGENRGIAAAQNVGIHWARNRGAGFVLLMDQDSIPAPDMVEKLISTISEHALPAAAGPRYLDERQDNPPPFIRVRGLRLERCACATGESVVPVDYLIASGCLIPMSVLDKVGGMRDDFFIDYVDIEWGLRAKSLGWQSWGVFAARMSHSLGDSAGKFMGINYSIRSPLRHYYTMRNAVWLCQQAHVPRNWKWVEGYMIVLRFVLYTAFAKPRWAHVSKMTLGLVHGLKSRLGPYG